MDSAAAALEIKQGHVVHCRSDDEFYSALKLAQDRLVVVDCFASWCPPCQQIAPIFVDLATHHPEVVFVKIDVDEVTSKLKNDIGIWAMPTFCFYKHGKKIGSFMGANESLLRRGIANGGNVSLCSSFCAIQ